MKKFLSLVLALVMTMSLVTVSAGAKDFTDSSKINYAEAVDVMSAVKVIDGYADGSFNPSATLTRGAAAKIICNLILGPTTASALVADAAPYKDVPVNHTFAGYIAYCQKEGIISGYADGTFKPANSLTGYAFMKMLLGALGYKAENEGYTGPNWSINVAKRALNIGLDNGLVGDFNGVKAVNREEACLYAFNTLKATMVEYDKNSTVTVGNITIKEQSDAKDMANTGKTDGNIDNDGKMQFAEKYFTDLKMFPATDDFSRPATQWKIKAEEVGKYTDTPDLTYTKAVKASTIYKDLSLGSAIEKKNVTVYINGDEIDGAAQVIKKSNDTKIGKGFDTDANGVLTEVFYDKDDDSVIITQVVTYVGEIVKTVKATDKKDAYVKIATKTSAAVGANPTRPTSASYYEFETDDKFEDEEYVLYTYSLTADEVKSVAAATKVEGYVSKTINKIDDEDKNNGMTIAGTEYKMSCAVAGEALGNVSVKNDYTAYLDQYGYVIFVEEIEEIGNYALLLDVANRGTFVGKKAELLFTDGTTKVVTTEKDYSDAENLKYDFDKDGTIDSDDTTAWKGASKGFAAGNAQPVIVTYKVDADGVYTLRAVDVNKASYTVASDKLVLTNDKAGIKTDAGTVTANSASVFVVADAGSNEDFTAYTGIKNAPSIDTTAAGSSAQKKADVFYYTKTSGGMVTVMFILPGSAVTVEDDNNSMLFLSKKGISDLIHDADGDYFEYSAIVKGEVKTVKVDMDKVPTDASGDRVPEQLAGLYKSFTTNKYGIITDMKGYTQVYDTDLDNKQILQPATGIAKTSKEYTVTLDTAAIPTATVASGVSPKGDYVITVDDNAKIYYVDKDGKISEIGYNGIAQDDDDIAYAIVEDHMVKTLVIQEVETKDPACGVKVTVTDAQATVKVDGSVVKNGKTAEYDKNDKGVVITVTAKTGYTITDVKVDGTTVTLDKNGEYTISKITDLHKVVVTTAPEAPASMKVLVTYKNGTTGVIMGQEVQTVNESATTKGFAEVFADDVKYTVVGGSMQLVAFEANTTTTVTFVVS